MKIVKAKTQDGTESLNVCISDSDVDQLVEFCQGHGYRTAVSNVPEHGRAELMRIIAETNEKFWADDNWSSAYENEKGPFKLKNELLPTDLNPVQRQIAEFVLDFASDIRIHMLD